VGIGAIKPREQHKLYGTEKEKDLLRPIEGFWSTIAVESAKKQISVDLFMFPEDYCELVTLGQVCHLTNGSQYLFVNFTNDQDRLRLQAALDKSLVQEQAGYAGILRVRCSNGLTVKGYRGHYLKQDPHDMDLASVQGSSTFFVDIGYEAKLDPKSSAFMQCALLYTTRSGRRRIRVHTLRFTISNTYAQLYRNTDLEANVFAAVQDCLVDAVNKGPKEARAESLGRLIKMLISYRKYCSAGSHSGQLLMPEQLKLLPIYLLCAHKSDALVAGTNVRIDERVQCVFDMMSMPLQRLLGFLYPRMFAVHNLLAHPNAGIISETTGQCFLPTLMQLTCEVVMSHGIYVLHDQQARLVYLWLGSQVSPKISAQLFGVDDAAAVGVSVHIEDFHPRLRQLLRALMLQPDGGMDRLLIVHEHEMAEEAFFRNMLEDENAPGLQSYSDLLCHVHKQINTRLS
jgi:protein transport protein SEC24